MTPIEALVSSGAQLVPEERVDIKIDMSARRVPEKQKEPSALERATAKLLAQQAAFRGIALPVSLTLGVTLPLLSIVWFLLPAHKVVRQLPIAVPLIVLASGLAFVALFIHYYRQERAVK
ncbi:MAG: hypothetical protein QM770_13530 [Tepidisphaeraceae bacterium]